MPTGKLPHQSRIIPMAHPKIDVHAHFIPPVYRDALLAQGHTQPDGMPRIPAWSADAHLSYMDAHHISKSILSISSPGTNLSHNDPALNATLTRQCNDFAASVARQHPTRFGFFATLPWPDTQAAIAEIARALDELKADGIALLSNMLGVYLGDPVLRPVLAELDRRRAVVFVHPTVPCAHHKGSPTHASPSERYAESSPLATTYATPVFEYIFDTTRSMIDLLASGTAARFPRIRWIVSHCGAALPSLLDRIFLMLRLGPAHPQARDAVPVTEEGLRKALREQCWFDLAGEPVPNLVEAMLRFVGKERLLFGSDVPWTPWGLAGELVERIEKELPASVGEEWVESIYRGNAEALLGRGEEKE